eukprot:1353836-Prorocentrum_lima.AAC.1
MTSSLVGSEMCIRDSPSAVSFTPLSPLFLSPEEEHHHTYMAPHSEYVDDFVLRISADSPSQLQ